MSEENIELLRQGFAAFERGDIDAVIEIVHSDVEWAPAIAPILGVDAVRGKEGLRRFLSEDLAAGFEGFRAEILSVEGFGEAVLANTRYSARGESSGMEIDQSFWTVYVIRDRKLIWMRDFQTREEAVAAAEERG